MRNHANSRKARVPQRANNYVVVAKIIRTNAQLLNPKPRRAASQQTTIVMIPDFRFAVRQLLKTPGFTTVAMLTLALAIGVNSAIFALINGVVLKPVVPVRPNEVVNVFTARQNASHDYRQFSYNEYRELRENGGDVFVNVAALEFAVAGIGRDHDMRRSFAFLTSENYFPMMGVQPFRGRFYDAEECKPNANMAVVVASYGFWKRNGGGNDFVGSTLHINGQPYTVIGIAPDGFSGANALVAPDIWVPLGMRSQLGSAFGDSETTHDLLNPKNYTFNLTARLRPGLTMDAAKARLTVLAQRLNAVQPEGSEGARELQIQTPSRFSLSTQPEDDGPITLIATLLMAMAGAVLLIACLNLANMLLARGTSRSKEIAVRLAVGASRWQIVRQLLCEGFLLAVCGGAIGLVFSAWCNDLLLQQLRGLLSSVNFSFVVKLRPDAAVVAVTFFFCLIATMLFSLGPALKATKADLVNDLKEQVGEPARIGRLSRFFAPRHISVMAQIALSLMSLYAAIAPGYCDALGIKLLRGRDFTQDECENKEARRVAIIDEEMAKKLFPNEDPIGQHIRYTQPPKDGSPNDMEIVGVVSKHRHDIQNDSVTCRLFVPLSQGYSGQTYLHVRLNTQDRRAVVAFIPTLRQTLREIDPELPLLQMTAFVDLMEKSPNLWIVKLGATLFGAFGTIALLLAVVGVYGVKAYAVACRTREIGIRMALGAHRRDVFTLIMRQAAMQTALAIGIGLVLSLGAGRVLAKILYQVSPTDPLALVSASLMLASAALLACFLPARRATHVNPMTALRAE